METQDQQTELPSLKSLLQLKKKYDAPTVDQLPDSYKLNGDKERLYIWAARNFERQIRNQFPSLQPLCLVCRNECNVEKLICTYIKPTVLPYSHLFDIDACAAFVSDFVTCERLHPKFMTSAMLASPTLTLATQVGNCVEVSNLLASLLTGFGFKAFVVCGWVERRIADMDRSKEAYSMAAPAEGDLAAEAEETSQKYEIRAPPLLTSKYCEFLEKSIRSPEERNLGSSSANLSQKSDKSETPKEQQPQKECSSSSANNNRHFHAWVYLQLAPDVCFFLEATTGERKRLADPDYLAINSVWNGENYWLAKDDGLACWKTSGRLDLGSADAWIPFVPEMEEPDGQASKRLLSPLQCWVADLQVPSDSYELLYRLGQKSELYDRVRVEYFAPYLLKEGTVQKVLHFAEAQVDGVPSHTVERFRHRVDRMTVRETFPGDRNRVVESFSAGRADNLRAHERLRLTSVHPAEHVFRFYSEARSDGLSVRTARDLEVAESYVGRPDGLRSMRAAFVMGEKKFGPAVTAAEAGGGGGGRGGGNKEVAKIVERFGEVALAEEEESFNPGRVLDASRVMERVFDVENERILLKFHREGGQLFCKTVEFLSPRPSEDGKRAAAAAGQLLSTDDVKVGPKIP